MPLVERGYRSWAEMRAEGIELTIQEYVDEVRGFHDYEPDPPDPSDPDYFREDDTEYRVILVQDTYWYDVARWNFATALGWYFAHMKLVRGLPSISVATCRNGYDEMQTAYEHAACYAQEWNTCETDEPLESDEPYYDARERWGNE